MMYWENGMPSRRAFASAALNNSGSRKLTFTWLQIVANFNLSSSNHKLRTFATPPLHMPMKRKVTKGISWQSDALLEAAQKKAKEMGLSFSAYICHLVRKDLGWKGVFSQEAPSPNGASSPNPPNEG